MRLPLLIPLFLLTTCVSHRVVIKCQQMSKREDVQRLQAGVGLILRWKGEEWRGMLQEQERVWGRPTTMCAMRDYLNALPFAWEPSQDREGDRLARGRGIFYWQSAGLVFEGGPWTAFPGQHTNRPQD